ncbi:hypothetical protein OSTOST_12901 [Ostertagia ostertagi]
METETSFAKHSPSSPVMPFTTKRPPFVFHYDNRKSENIGQERVKTLVTFLCFIIVGLINHFVLAVVSDIISRLPLPDLTHSVVAQNDTLRHMADTFTSAAVFLLLLICCVFHKHRWIVFRRLCYILTVLYLMRAISICLTHIPSGFSLI